LPLQILIQNLIYDFTQIAIPWDNVDDEFLQIAAVNSSILTTELIKKL